MVAIAIPASEVCRIAEINPHTFKDWRDRRMIKHPFNIQKTLAISIGRYLADRGVAIDIVRIPITLLAGMSEDELLAQFTAGRTRLTLDFDTRECVVETPSAVAQRIAGADVETARILSLPLRTDYNRVVEKLKALTP
jgi:hypothetical protein